MKKQIFETRNFTGTKIRFIITKGSIKHIFFNDFNDFQAIFQYFKDKNQNSIITEYFWNKVIKKSQIHTIKELSQKTGFKLKETLFNHYGKIIKILEFNPKQRNELIKITEFGIFPHDYSKKVRLFNKITGKLSKIITVFKNGKTIIEDVKNEC